MSDGCVENSSFPEGMRVLAVDDNKVCLKILSALLKKCRYEVTEMLNKTEAIELLKHNVDKFDIVLTNVNIDEMDGFKLLEAGLELDIPVIMISASESKDMIMKGVRHGAVSYLLKPVSFEAVQTIWQYVYRKQLPNSITSTRDVELCPTNNNDIDDGLLQDDAKTIKIAKRSGKRKLATSGDEGVNVDDYDIDNDSEGKKGRIKWTKRLHDKFLDAIEKLGGGQKAVPKKILELMGEPDIAREKVASHLQKYRKYMKKSESTKLVDSNNSLQDPYGLTTLTSTFNHQQPGGGNMFQGGSSGLANYRPWSIGPSIDHYQHQPLPLRVNPGFMPQQRMAPQPSFGGNFTGPSSNFWLDQPQQQLHPPFESTSQAPDELFDSGPPTIEPMFDPALPLNVMYDQSQQLQPPLNGPCYSPFFGGDSF